MAGIFVSLRLLQKLTGYNLHNEKATLLRIGQGDKQAFDELFKRYYASLVLYGEKCHLGREDAEDAAMDVLAKLWKGREKLPAVNYLPAYLYKAMKNACVDHLKKRNRSELTEKTYHQQGDPEDDAFALREAIRAEVLQRINEDIQALPDKYRTVFELTYHEGLNTAEIAARLGISVTNVTSRRNRALQMLKKELIKKDLLFIYFLLSQIR